MKLLNSFKIKSGKVNSLTFFSTALDLFHYQAKSCTIYHDYIKHLKIDTNKLTSIYQIPCLPIEFFKKHDVKTGDWEVIETYLSSGTTGTSRSKHLIEDPDYYLLNAKAIFEELNYPIKEVCFFALLPSYQEQGNSSLIKMVDYFIKESESAEKGGFYLNRTEELIQDIKSALRTADRPVILFGVGYALLDLAAIAQLNGDRLDGLIIIETGGMKGKRKDMVKSEFYSVLKEALGNIDIRSEYGMTELLSQAYSTNESTYKLPSQMKVLIRDPEDPLHYLPYGSAGGINIIDLANVHSCAFIETRDLGRLNSNDEFEIIGRLDNSDIRGCNLMTV